MPGFLPPGLCVGHFPQPYCPLPFSAITHSPARARPLTWASVTLLDSEGSGQWAADRTWASASWCYSPHKLRCPVQSPHLEKPRAALGGTSTHKQSPLCWGHPKEPFWSDHQLLRKCPHQQVTVQHQPLRMDTSQSTGRAPGGSSGRRITSYLMGHGEGGGGESLQSLGSQDSRRSEQWAFASSTDLSDYIKNEHSPCSPQDPGAHPPRGGHGCLPLGSLPGTACRQDTRPEQHFIKRRCDAPVRETRACCLPATPHPHLHLLLPLSALDQHPPGPLPPSSSCPTSTRPVLFSRQVAHRPPREEPAFTSKGRKSHRLASPVQACFPHCQLAPTTLNSHHTLPGHLTSSHGNSFWKYHPNPASFPFITLLPPNPIRASLPHAPSADKVSLFLRLFKMLS